MVWSSSLTLILCLRLSLRHTHTHTHIAAFPPFLPPFLPLIHSLTLGDALLHSSLPGAVEKAGETHKSKLKCSSECFLDMMHGSWDAARPCCYTCKLCWHTQDPRSAKKKKQDHSRAAKLGALSCIFTDLLHSIRNLFYVLDLVAWFRCERESQLTTSCRGFKRNKEVALRRCHSSFCCLLPRRCKTGSSSLCFPSEHQQFRCHLFPPLLEETARGSV